MICGLPSIWVFLLLLLISCICHDFKSCQQTIHQLCRRFLCIEICPGQLPFQLLLGPVAVRRFDHVADSCHKSLPVRYQVSLHCCLVRCVKDRSCPFIVVCLFRRVFSFLLQVFDPLISLDHIAIHLLGTVENSIY